MQQGAKPTTKTVWWEAVVVDLWALKCYPWFVEDQLVRIWTESNNVHFGARHQLCCFLFFHYVQSREAQSNSLHTDLGSLPGLRVSFSAAVTWLPDYMPSMKWPMTCFAEDCETCLVTFVKPFKDQTTTTTAQQSQAFLRESRRFWSKFHARVHLLWYSPTTLYMALVLPVVRGKPPEVFSQLELPAWGTKVEMGPAECTASTFAQVQSHTGFTKPFPFNIYYDPPQGDGRKNKVIRKVMVMKVEYGKGGGVEKDHVIVCVNTCLYLPDSPYSQWLLLLLAGNIQFKIKMS